ncbi:MAG: DUF4258 domain-containing protein [Aeromonas sp.]
MLTYSLPTAADAHTPAPLAINDHASRRMQQRAIGLLAIDLLLDFGRSCYHRGGEMVYFDKHSFRFLQGRYHLTPNETDKLRHQYLVLSAGDLISVGHKTAHFKRDRS